MTIKDSLKISLLLIAIPASAGKLTLTALAAGTTIAVNALTIKETAAKAIKAARATKKVAVKAAKKVTGK